MYSWGRGEDGQLGIGDTSDQDEPTYVDALRGVGVKEIACGSGHTVVLTGEGEVYTWLVVFALCDLCECSVLCAVFNSFQLKSCCEKRLQLSFV